MRNAGKSLKSWLGRFDTIAPRRPDPWLWLPGLGLMLLGLLMVLNTTYFLSLEKTGAPFYFIRRQLFNTAIGVCVLFLFSQFSARGLRRIAVPLMIIAVAMLIAVWIPGLGVIRGGARRWLRVGPLLAEPSEVVKLAAAFILAEVLSRRDERMQNFVGGPLPAFLIIAPLAALILKQPDFGNTVMLAVLLFAMLFAAGARTAHLASAGAGALALFVFQAGHEAYRMRRLSAFLDPWHTARGAGFQLVQSFIALGAGGGWGVGLGVSRQKMFYLPQAHTDFVFAVIGEEFGMVGALVVIALFAIILWRGMRIARNETDNFASLLAVGLTALLSLQALVNIAVVIGLLPTKGLPLPFVSYGGTSMLTSMAALGALLALGRRQAVRCA
ncbi:MAG TPA: putative lipid II flippase FtsW [Candidatus Binataceae bacterium]|nr:putative lipid II flippase FtsW [Candidatus Binataceae bacterium]